MRPKLLELRPNRDLLQPDFNGYKLSLNPIPVISKQLTDPVHRALPDTGQYSVLHAKLFGLHNHIIGEVLDNITYIYFIDAFLNVQKTYIDPASNTLLDLITLWQVPNGSYKQSGDYNISLKVFAEDLAVLSNGAGMLYILNTGQRSSNNYWSILYCEEILGHGEKFVIQDVLYDNTNTDNKTLHVLLLSIAQEKPTESFINIINWVTIKEGDDKKWGPVALRELRAKGDLHYCYFEPGGEALYVASEKGVKFTLDSENPVVDTKESKLPNEKKYQWSQTKEDINIKFNLPDGTEKNNIIVETKPTELNVKLRDEILLFGTLYQAVDTDVTTWCITNGILEVNLNKTEVGLMWPELVEGDDNGEFIINTQLSEVAHQQLEHLCSDTETLPQGGTTFNSQQVEDCDFLDDKSGLFERICCKTHHITHRVYLGTHPILMTAKLFENLPPSLGLRHDVDVCLWQPSGKQEDWHLEHSGTLLAFGYVQASKQQRKFLSCTPDLSYSFICESSRHVFVYCQNKSITDGELRNRSTGRRIGSIAEQRVISIENEEILGMYASNTELFLLTENTIFCFKL